MKIALDCRLWNEGGVGRYIRNLVYHLEQLDKKNSYTLLFYEKSPLLNKENFRVQITKSKWHTFSEQFNFCQELNKGHYDLVHFPYFSHPIFYTRPHVVTIHDLTILHYATGQATTKNLAVYWLKRLGYQAVLRQAVRGAAQIIVPSQFVKTDLEKYYPRANRKTTVTYEGVGQEFVNLKATRPKLSLTQPFLLSVGNFYPHKNIDFLVETFLNLKPENLSLVLCGPNDFFAKRLQERLAQRSGVEQIHFYPQATESELVWFYQQAEALVFPSLFEGFGLPIVEAASFGCPLLLSDIAVFREIAPSTALFFDPQDPQDFLAKLGHIRKTKAPIKQEYFKRFSFAQLAKDTLAVYNRVNI